METPVPNPNSTNNQPGLRTYHNDVADILAQKQAEIDKITAPQPKPAQQTSQRILAGVEESNPRVSIFILALSGLLVLVAIIAFAYFFIFAKKSSQSTTQAPAIKQLIATDSVITATASTQITPLIAFNNAHEKLSGAPGSVVAVQITDPANASKYIDGPTFLASLGTSVPAELQRSIDTPFLAGYELTDSWQPFVILKLTSYDNAYASMLAWEPTMATGLQSFIGTSTQNLLGFQDVLMKNKDVRELTDLSGNPILLYSLPDKQTLVITTNEATMNEILGRLSASQF